MVGRAPPTRPGRSSSCHLHRPVEDLGPDRQVAHRRWRSASDHVGHSRGRLAQAALEGAAECPEQATSPRCACPAPQRGPALGRRGRPDDRPRRDPPTDLTRRQRRQRPERQRLGDRRPAVVPARLDLERNDRDQGPAPDATEAAHRDHGHLRCSVRRRRPTLLPVTPAVAVESDWSAERSASSAAGGAAARSRLVDRRRRRDPGLDPALEMNDSRSAPVSDQVCRGSTGSVLQHSPRHLFRPAKCRARPPPRRLHRRRGPGHFLADDGQPRSGHQQAGSETPPTPSTASLGNSMPVPGATRRLLKKAAPEERDNRAARAIVVRRIQPVMPTWRSDSR